MVLNLLLVTLLQKLFHESPFNHSKYRVACNCNENKQDKKKENPKGSNGAYNIV